MHALIHIITDHEIKPQLVTVGKNTFQTMPELEEIMAPYYENDFYDKYYDEELDDVRDIPPEDYPEFLWDYYRHFWTKSVDEINKMDRRYDDRDFSWKWYSAWSKKLTKDMDARDIVDICYVLIDKDRNVIAKLKWNGIDHVDQEKEFVKAAAKIKADLKPTDWITEVDYHD